MAVEEKRKCGYRKVGGIYFVGDAMGDPCPRLPYNLHICPVCSAGIKFSMGFTWIDPNRLFGVQIPSHKPGCYMCTPPIGKHGLLWVGAAFYTPEEFISESHKMGVSKRIASIPNGFEIGKHIIYLAHKKAGEELHQENRLFTPEIKKVPAIFMAFKPVKIEKIMTESQIDHLTESEKKMYDRKGISLIAVPDSDIDHKGSVYDKKE